MADQLLKVAAHISEDEVKRLLELFAELGENEAFIAEGEEAGGSAVDAAKLGKLKLSLERDGDGFFLKVKGQAVKAEREDFDDDDFDEDDFDSDTDEKPQGKIKYKSLKKRMKKTWKVIKDSARTNTLPPENVVESFLDDSALMITYPGKGDEYYKPYAVAHEAFAAAWRAQDVEALGHAVKRLDHLKEACHDIHK